MTPQTLAMHEPTGTYRTSSNSSMWIEVLVDCPGVEGLFTYQVPDNLRVEPGDLVSVPFGSQILGGIVIRLLTTPPPDLPQERIKTIVEIIATRVFPSHYWQLISEVAKYYTTDLLTVIRLALPPGLLGRSQRRLKINSQSIPPGGETFCTPKAQAILHLLRKQPETGYTYKYITQQIRGANQGIKELSQRGWIVSYLEPPRVVRPKRQKAVTKVVDAPPENLTNRQREILEVLGNRGGELWLTELQRLTQSSPSTIATLAQKGYLVIETRERLRLEQGDISQHHPPQQLTLAQKQALETITNLSGFAQVLLHGVTGSGKTEVYLQAIAPLLTAGKSALVLVPEIGLTPQLTDRFRARFGTKVRVYHSALTEGERYDTWREVLRGEPQIVIGTRSAIFLPLSNLGLIVLDEEHDSSFQESQRMPTYHARLVAKWQAQLASCPLVLGSATPASETWHLFTQNQEDSIYYLSLPERIYSRPLPPVTLVDMRQELQRGNRSLLSDSLSQALSNLKASQQQAILFIPRRGYSTFVSCRTCGYVLECSHCDVSLSYHYTHTDAPKLLRCHYCNYTTMQPDFCPECGSPYLKFFGSGTQKVYAEVNRLFPDLNLIRFDSDTTRTKGAHRHLLQRFARGEADVLIGTQMLTKGIDVEQVTLVGVVAADGLLHRSNYRTGEQAFQILTQVAGRAGRGAEPGQVIIQTYSPEHPVIQAVKNQDYLGFMETELQERAELNYPPYGSLVLLRLTSLELETVERTAFNLAEVCTNQFASQATILGPAPAQVMRVARRYRWQILLKFPHPPGEELAILPSLKQMCPSSVSMSVSIDPLEIE